MSGGRPRLTIGELCAGYGGLGMGVGQVLDAEVAWYSEIDKGALKILEHRFAGVPNIGDMTTVDWATVPKVDLLCAGYPCQPFSHAGKRKGTDDSRHLWPHVREAIRHLRPRLTVLENVSGHRSLGFDRVLGDLAEDGMHVVWTSVRASDVGAPHRRERLFIGVAHTEVDARWLEHRDGATAPDRDIRGCEGGPELDSVQAQVAADRDSSGRHPDGCLLPSPRTSDTNGAGAHGDGGLDLRTAVTLLPTPTCDPDTGNGHARNLGREAKLIPTPLNSDAGPRGGTTGFGLRDWSRASEAWGDYADAIARWESLTRPAPAPTMLSKRDTPQLSPAFSEWMMGLPAGWVTDVPGITRNEALRALGNGVVPQQAAAAVGFLLDEFYANNHRKRRTP